jgi:hypothetical protein
MYPSSLLRLLLAACLLAALLPAPTAEAQLLRRVQNRVQERVEQAADRAATRAIGGTETAEASAPAPQASPAAPDPGARPGEGAWVNYDFVPGERVLFAEDFGTDRVGDFPRRFAFRSGNFEVAEWRGQRLLRGTSFGEFAIELLETLPERFTLEFDAAVPSGWVQEVRFAGSAGNFVRFGLHQGGLERMSTQGVRAESAPAVAPGAGVLFPVRVMADGAHVKVYLADTRVANVPTADLGRSRTLTFKVSASQDHPAFFGNFRVAAGGLDLYDALAAEGRVATQGILFETASARLRPESTPPSRRSPRRSSSTPPSASASRATPTGPGRSRPTSDSARSARGRWSPISWPRRASPWTGWRRWASAKRSRSPTTPHQRAAR